MKCQYCLPIDPIYSELRQARLYRGWSLRETALRMGVNKVTLYTWDAYRNEGNLTDARRYAQILGYSIILVKTRDLKWGGLQKTLEQYSDEKGTDLTFP